MSAAGAAADPVYVDDVFSTFLYDGTGSAQTITNNIDISGEGALVWIKSRTQTTASHCLYDTERGAGDVIFSNSTSAEVTDTSLLSAFTSSGFSLGTGAAVNQSGEDYCSWTFRKCPGFFDVVTYTGDGNSSKTLSHSLGSAPGFVAVKRTDTSGMGWYCYHRGLYEANKKFVRLESTMAAYSFNNNDFWGVSSTDFTVYGATTDTNISGATYVAYLFAHDDQSFGDDEDEAIIKCGSFTSTGSVVDINLGFEPQWILMKRSDASNSWIVVDSMRGNPVGSAAQYLEPNGAGAESTITGWTVPTPTGFTNNYPISGGNFIYIAIRRPNKPPETGTDVFAVDSRGSTGDGNEPTYRSGFPVDMQFNRNVTYQGGNMQISARLTQGAQMHTNLTNQESTNSTMMFDYMNGVQTDTGTGSNQYAWMFKRAPGFFDVVTYTGTGSVRTVNHNLGVAPELMIVKQRDGGSYWAVYSSALGATKYLQLNGNNAEGTSVAVWNNTSPTSSVFTVNYAGAVNGSGNEYIAYLFASLSGISKIGTYTGTGSARNLDFGFTAGARFFLYKRTDDSQNWVVFDTGRGITAGTDYGIPLNEIDAQFSGDYVDPYNAGISLTGSVANNSGATFIYLAIA
jgi:hypothetical protein